MQADVDMYGAELSRLKARKKTTENGRECFFAKNIEKKADKLAKKAKNIFINIIIPPKKP